MTRRLPPGRPTAALPPPAEGAPVAVTVRPDQVWPAPGTKPPALGPEPASHSFFAPIALVTALSSALMTGFLVLLGVWLWLER